MATLNLKSFGRLVQDASAAIQTKTPTLIDFTVGSILRAVVEAVAGVALWLQGMVLQVLLLTRAATSNGPDLDTWMADYGLQRLQSNPGQGTVRFSRFTATTSALVPLGALVQTADGTQNFEVTLDLTNPLWNPGQNGYLMINGVTHVDVPVVALSGDTRNNIQSNTISVMLTAISGVDFVNNPSSFQGGTKSESDSDFRTRFIQYIESLRQGTNQAVRFAGNSCAGPGVQCTVLENIGADGHTAQPGWLYVTIDDGTGTPPQSLINAATAAINIARAAGVMFTCNAPNVIHANIAIQLNKSAGQDQNTIAAVNDAVQSFVNNLGLGTDLAYSQLFPVIFNASSNVGSVQSLTINNDTQDIPASGADVIKIGTLTVV